MSFKLNAAMSGANIGRLADEVKKLEQAGIDSFHIDIMDGVFVPSFAMSLNDLRCIAKYATRPIDVHLMIQQPHEQIELFLRELRKGDTVYIHPEAEYHPSTTLQKIIDAGMIPGIAINPGTSIETIMEMLVIVDKVLVMTENPGEEFAMEMNVEKKLELLEEKKEELDFEIVYEGRSLKDKIADLYDIGVDDFIINKDLFEGGDYGNTVATLKDTSKVKNVFTYFEYVVGNKHKVAVN
ncbi:MAG: ribulose phosphate epimerase [Pseudobutyrivibrio sp.]|nr:ribulose phosphate epimerase [Pseudobutyrivibrio sp.]